VNPRRATIVLLGGDKTDDWSGLYEPNVALADDLYDEYLDWRGMVDLMLKTHKCQKVRGLGVDERMVTRERLRLRLTILRERLGKKEPGRVSWLSYSARNNPRCHNFSAVMTCNCPP
jgi:hypothetical protein